MTEQDRRDPPADPTAPQSPADARLLADIGATYARFCIEKMQGHFERVAVLPCDDYADVVQMVRAYLDSVPDVKPRHGALAIAYPIDGDWVHMTNRSWEFSIQEVQRALGLTTLLVVNNFTALAMALPGLPEAKRVQIGAGVAAPDGVIGVIGPGTGLGVSALIPSNDRWITLNSEGGHASFAPADEREMRILRHAWKTMPHVSAERLISGPGIETIYEALRDGHPGEPTRRPTADIVSRAQRSESALCVETIDCFCAMLGTVAADLALTLCATGGVYIGGGIVPRLGALFQRSSFRQRFESKGRFSAYVARIPTYVLTADNLAFHGMSKLLAEHMPNADSGNPMFERIRHARNQLSPAERRVANWVLENPRAVLNDPVIATSRNAEVSQPTVIRFCRSLGFEGLADFKLKLASGLTGAIRLQRTHVKRQDAMADMCAKVLDNTMSSIANFRELVNVEDVERAIALLRDASRVELFAVGDSAIVALDAQQKLLRFRMPVAARTDPYSFGIATESLHAKDVALIISGTGQSPEVVRAATSAKARGASVIAITSSRSPLAKKADVCIDVDHDEDSPTFVAMISRILHLLVVDLLAVGLAVRRLPEGGSVKASPNDPSKPGRSAPPGVWISHIR